MRAQGYCPQCAVPLALSRWGPAFQHPSSWGSRCGSPWQHSKMGTEAGTTQEFGESAGRDVNGGNSVAKAEGFPGTYWKLRGSEKGETSGGTLGTPYSACGDHVVVSITGAGRYPGGFWERLWRAGLGRGREPEDHGGFVKVEVAFVVCLFILGTHSVGAVWVTSVCEGPALRSIGKSWMTGWVADSF